MVEIAILTSEKVPFRGVVPFFDKPNCEWDWEDYGRLEIVKICVIICVYTYSV
jgi:hypothetical protein